MKKEFNLEYQYQLYLERCGVRESMLGDIQAKEMKQAFYGACGQMLFLMRDDIAALEEDEAVEVLENIKNQIGNYFHKANQRQN
jgi:hypothetical protein